jgi:dynein assembly factor with WDR repeat domains 1
MPYNPRSLTQSLDRRTVSGICQEFQVMKLKRFLLRYYPPGIILEYELRDKTREMKEVSGATLHEKKTKNAVLLQIDLLHLTTETDVEVLINQIVFEEPLISDSRKPQVRNPLHWHQQAFF